MCLQAHNKVAHITAFLQSTKKQSQFIFSTTTSWLLRLSLFTDNRIDNTTTRRFNHSLQSKAETIIKIMAMYYTNKILFYSGYMICMLLLCIVILFVWSSLFLGTKKRLLVPSYRLKIFSSHAIACRERAGPCFSSWSYHLRSSTDFEVEYDLSMQMLGSMSNQYLYFKGVVISVISRTWWQSTWHGR